jgi:hypothetical protein
LFIGTFSALGEILDDPIDVDSRAGLPLSALFQLNRESTRGRTMSARSFVIVVMLMVSLFQYGAHAPFTAPMLGTICGNDDCPCTVSVRMLSSALVANGRSK